MSDSDSAPPTLVRLRPGPVHVGLLLGGVASMLAGFDASRVLGIPLLVAGAALLLVVGLPILVSTVFRVPVVAIDAAGLRLPLMGVRLPWAQVVAVKRAWLRPEAASPPVLLIVVAEPDTVVGQARVWLRSEARANLVRFGTPIVVPGRSLDHSIDAIAAAIHRHGPRRLHR